MRKSTVIVIAGIGQFLIAAAAWGQSCSSLDPAAARQCQVYDQAKQVYSTKCPAGAAAQCAASIAKIEALRSQLFAGVPSPVQAPSATDVSTRARPLPVPATPAKLPFLRGFYIGMSVDQALAAAATALAPLQAAYRTEGDVINVVVPGDLSRLGIKEIFQNCVADKRRGRFQLHDDECERKVEDLQFQFEVSKTGAISRVAIRSIYVIKPYGYNLEASGLSFEEFGQLIGKKVGARVEFGRKESPTTECYESGGDGFSKGTTKCKTNKNEESWYNINNVAVCKCSITFYESGNLYMVPIAAKNPEAIR